MNQKLGVEKINPQLKALIRPIKGLKPNPDNDRHHSEKNIKAIENSFREFGQQKPIVALSNGVVIDGNGTLEALRRLKMSISSAVKDFTEGHSEANSRV